MGGNWRRDLPTNQYDKHLRVCQELWKENPVAKKGVQNFRSFVASEGFHVRSTCKDPKKQPILQTQIDQHLRINNWKFAAGKRIETLAVEGEWDYQILTPNPITGHCRIAKVNPEDIKAINPDALDSETMVTATLCNPRTETVYQPNGTHYTIEHTELEIVRRDPITGRLKGNLLHLPINQLTGQTRGWSDLLVVADYLDSMDLLVVGEVDRHRLMKVFAWVVKISGADPKTVLKRKQELRQEGPPQSGDLLITDGSEEWDTKTPALNLQESVLFCEFLLMLIFGGLNMPQHWYSQGGDVNKATAGEMGTPVMAQVRARKELVMEFLLWEVEIALWHLYEGGFLPPEITPKDLTIEVLSQDPERNTYQAVGQMLAELGAALDLAASKNWITGSDAGKKFRQAAESLGLGQFLEPLPSSATPEQMSAAIQESLRLQAADREAKKITRNNEEWSRHW